MRLRDIISIVLAGVFIGAIVGYGIAYSVYQPKIKDLGSQVSNLSAQVSDLTSSVSNQQTQIFTLKAEKDSLATDLSKARGETERYVGLVGRLESQISGLQKELSDSKLQTTNIQKKLDNILNITVKQNYQWVYGWQTWQWELPIPLSVYVEYMEKQRPRSGDYYVNMTKDPRDDAYIDQMVRKVNEAALKEGFTEIQKLNFLIAFVQSLPYTVDEETTPYDEYPRYPVETLFDRGGDCEDTSILVAALLDRMAYDVALLLLRDARHMAVGVSLPNAEGSYYEYNNKKYFYLETTGDGWQIGQFPPTITNRRAFIYPLRS